MALADINVKNRAKRKTHVHRSCSLQHSLFKAQKRLKNKGKSSDDFIQSLV